MGHVKVDVTAKGSPAAEKTDLNYKKIMVRVIKNGFHLAIAINLVITILSAIIFGIEISNLKSGGRSIMDDYSSLEDKLDTLLQRVAQNSSQTASSLQEHNNSINSLNQQPFETQDDSALNVSLLQNFFDDINLGMRLNPAASCASLSHTAPSGYYWVRSYTGSAVHVYCNMTLSCGGVTGGWTRLAELDMTNSSHQCPDSLTLRRFSNKRTCGTNNNTCRSVFYSVTALEYSKICGRVIGYQSGATDGFESRSSLITENYIDGVSITYGSQRKHVWSFASGLDEVRSLQASTCPCNNNGMSMPPSFVGNDYFCDTGSEDRFELGRFYGEDPLWDGAGCGPLNTCCSFNNPPWFFKQLPQPTFKHLELRLCISNFWNREDVALEIIDLFVW